MSCRFSRSSISALRPRDITGAKLQELLFWIKQVSHRYRGALLSTFLRDAGYAFSQLGNFVERADNTARILDMKYYVLLPRASLVGSDVDIQQWTMILRAASEHDLDLSQSLLVGDADRDIEMGMNAGVPITIRIESENPHIVTATHTLPDTTGLVELLNRCLH